MRPTARDHRADWWMVCVGTPFKGFTWHGPFDDISRAEEFGEDTSGDGFWWIHQVCPAHLNCQIEEGV
jgi:hypothetical protein